MTTTRRVRTSDDFGGIEIQLIDTMTDTGDGAADRPVVVLAHGFPESSHSWRHQIEPLAEAGYRVLVPDQRGYAASSAPRDVAAYRSDRLAADLLALLDDVDADDAVFVGHDWGALLVWDLARLHPDRVRAVVNVSVPYTPWPIAPTELFRMTYGDRYFYMLHFQQVGPAEAELEADVREAMRMILWGGSGELYRPASPVDELPAASEAGFLTAFAGREVPAGLPGWLTPDDLDTYTRQFEASGFFGPVSWYRNLDADWELTKDLPAPSMPCAFIGGAKDLVIAGRPEYLDSLGRLLPDFRGATLIDGAGHWTQQERPDEFNSALLDALRACDA